MRLDFAPLCDTARMLYGSSFVAERAAGIADFLLQLKDGSSREAGGDARWLVDVATDERLLPVTRSIIGGAGVHFACLAVLFVRPDGHWQTLYKSSQDSADVA